MNERMQSASLEDEKGSNLDADYTASLSIDSSPASIFDALTTISGLSGWWTNVTGSGAEGGELSFTFQSPDELRMHVTQAQRPSKVVWDVEGYAPIPDWAGTTISYEMSPNANGGSELRFKHRGLTPRLVCYSDCKSGWDHFLPSLKSFVQTGVGNPMGSAADDTRREERNRR